MISQRERADEQTVIRRKLLANGYTPLANDDKRNMLRNWPRIEVTPALIEEWSDKLRYQATGVRLDGALTVIDIDIDIDDAEVIDDIVDRLPEELWERLGVAPERRGKGAKLAWFVRCEEPFQRYASMTFARPGEDPEGEGIDLHRVEVFGPRATRQFGAFGAHTMGRGVPLVEYRWTDRSLLDVPLDDLPTVTLDEVDLVCRIANEVLEARGWARHKRSKSGNGSSGVVYDVTDEMKFETRDHGTLTLAELEELAQGETGIRLSASWLEGPAARNTTRCIAGTDHSGRLQIYETAAGDLHKAAREEPRVAGSTARDQLSRYSGGTLFSSGGGQGTPRSGGGDPVDLEDGEDTTDLRAQMQNVVDYLLREYAFCPSEDKPVYPISGGPPMSMTNFRESFNSAQIETVGPKGGVKKVHPVDFWRTDPDRVQIIGERFDPSTEDRLLLVREEGEEEQWALNLYRPVKHARGIPDAVALAVWHDFLEHLFPHADEREWFRMWLAAKLQKPWQPNCAVLMFTETQGTGRGTLFDMLRGVIGSRHCSTVTSLQLLGDGGQSQYTKWLEGAVLCFCEELMSGEELGLNQGWKRKQAYERLKVLFEPRAREVEIIQKGKNNYMAYVFASFLLASNNPNALPIPKTDRRLAVLRNTTVKLERTEIGRRIDAMRMGDNKGFTAVFLQAIWSDLMSIAVDWQAVFNAPEWLEGRAEMIAANETEINHLVQDVMAQVPGDYITKADLKKRLAVTAEAAGLAGTSHWWRDARQILGSANDTGWRILPGGRQYLQPKAQGQKQDVVYFRVDGAGEQAFRDTALADRPELLRRGNDLNDKITRAGEALLDGRFAVIDGMQKDD
ncbi:MAG: hypothetical protein JJU07_06990 [Natronohydrobacter sp.]|nr:hypothetical protein [Natronohydrobacter sp.]